jgi:hypothetical protein
MAVQLSTLTVTIAKTNGTGFQTREEGDKWFTISRYVTPAPAIPATGTRAVVSIDPRGFVHGIEPADRSPAPAAPTSRETTIIRLACLKAASTFLATRPDAKSPDILKVAESLEGWVTR